MFANSPDTGESFTSGVHVHEFVQVAWFGFMVEMVFVMDIILNQMHFSTLSNCTDLSARAMCECFGV